MPISIFTVINDPESGSGSIPRAMATGKRMRGGDQEDGGGLHDVAGCQQQHDIDGDEEADLGPEPECPTIQQLGQGLGDLFSLVSRYEKSTALVMM